MKTAVFLLLTTLLFLALPSQTIAQYEGLANMASHYSENLQGVVSELTQEKEKEIKKGAKALLPYDLRETIVNLDPIRKPAYGANCGSEIYLFYKDTCRTREFGAIYVVGTIETNGGIVLVRYEPPEEETREGYCPKDTIYFKEKSYFLELLSEYDQILERQLRADDEKKQVKKLLEDE